MLLKEPVQMLLVCAAASYFGTSAVLDPEHRYASLFLVFICVSSLLRARRASQPERRHLAD